MSFNVDRLIRNDDDSHSAMNTLSYCFYLSTEFYVTSSVSKITSVNKFTFPVSISSQKIPCMVLHLSFVVFQKTVVRDLKWCHHFWLQSDCTCLDIQILGPIASRRQSIRWTNGFEGYEIHGNVSCFTTNEDLFPSTIYDHSNSRHETFLPLVDSEVFFRFRLDHTGIIPTKFVILTIFFPNLLEGSLSNTNVSPPICVIIFNWSIEVSLPFILILLSVFNLSNNVVVSPLPPIPPSLYKTSRAQKMMMTICDVIVVHLSAECAFALREPRLIQHSQISMLTSRQGTSSRSLIILLVFSTVISLLQHDVYRCRSTRVVKDVAPDWLDTDTLSRDMRLMGRIVHGNESLQRNRRSVAKIKNRGYGARHTWQNVVYRCRIFPSFVISCYI